ncbi:MAG: hypothetical protein HZC01_02675 [Candidatus Kerfeldbacteria bacterium]|nr:hypothetical protein [Candidatus Kerfeldbacteria bacterium]
MTYKVYRLHKPKMPEVEVSQALGLNPTTMYGGLYRKADMIGTVENGLLSIKEKFIEPALVKKILRIATPLP